MSACPQVVPLRWKPRFLAGCAGPQWGCALEHSRVIQVECDPENLGDLGLTLKLELGGAQTTRQLPGGSSAWTQGPEAAPCQAIRRDRGTDRLQEQGILGDRRRHAP